MASIRDMNMKQLNSVDWKTMSFEPETLKNHPVIINRILKCSQSQVAKFCIHQLDVELIRCIGVDNVVKLIHKAGVRMIKSYGALSPDLFISEFQYKKGFINQNQAILNLSNLYVQDCADVNMLSKYINEIDIINTIVHNAKYNNNNAEFINKNKNAVIDAMKQDFNSCAVSVKYLNDCAPDMDLNDISSLQDRHKKITQDLAKEIETYYNMHVPVEFIGNSIEEIAFKMNTNIMPSKYMTLCTVHNYLRDCHE